jgi:hypothetical protein
MRGTACVCCGPLVQVDSVALQNIQRYDGEGFLVRRRHHHWRRHAGDECFAPSRRANAPSIAYLESGKTVFRHRRRQIVALLSGIREKR